MTIIVKWNAPPLFAYFITNITSNLSYVVKRKNNICMNYAVIYKCITYIARYQQFIFQVTLFIKIK